MSLRTRGAVRERLEFGGGAAADQILDRDFLIRQDRADSLGAALAVFQRLRIHERSRQLSVLQQRHDDHQKTEFHVGSYLTPRVDMVLWS